MLLYTNYLEKMPINRKIIYVAKIIFTFIIPPSSGLRLLSYCCKRLLRRNVTFCTVWTLSVAFEEIVDGTKIDCGGIGVEKFFFDPWLCSFVFAQFPFSVFEITAMPLLRWKIELKLNQKLFNYL